MAYANGWSRAFEVAGTAAVFLLIGFGLDRLLGTEPWFTAIFGLIGFLGLGLRAYYRYQADMAREEEGKPWMRKAR